MLLLKSKKSCCGCFDRLLLSLLVFWCFVFGCVQCLHPIKSGLIQYIPYQPKFPQLILVAGATGTGRATFGMSLAMKKGILKCISTDTLRQVMRHSKDSASLPAALHRSSYEGTDDPVTNWRESANVLSDAVRGVVKDCAKRGVSLVLEGVHVVPSNDLLDLWTTAGGISIGVVLSIAHAEKHHELIYGKRESNTKSDTKGQINDFKRIRAIQEEMVRLGQEHQWDVINELIEDDPYARISEKIDKDNPAVPCKIHPLALL